MIITSFKGKIVVLASEDPAGLSGGETVVSNFSGIVKCGSSNSVGGIGRSNDPVAIAAQLDIITQSQHALDGHITDNCIGAQHCQIVVDTGEDLTFSTAVGN